MKRIVILIFLGVQAFFMNAQPIGLPPANNATAQAAAAWYRGGNNFVGNGNNIFGTRWNSGIYTMTNSVNRMKLNGTINYTYNGFAGNRDGYLLLGATSNDNFSNIAKGAASALHLNGRYNTFDQPERGYRPWMQTGITLTDNDDLSYFGLRRVGYENELSKSITETTICWSNDPTGQYGPDDMVFRFMGEAFPATSTINRDLLDNNDLDGRHVGRFTNLGLFGLGNTFGINGINDSAGVYVRPQSLLHMSYSNLNNIWSQYTNRNLSTSGIGTGGTGEADGDGLRIGIMGSSVTNINGTAAIYNQEERPILMSTNATTAGINISSGNTGERMRIMSVNTPTTVASGNISVYNPASLASNITRMSVSHNPTTPVTRPMSLLHLGYNTTSNSNRDGWRSWMDVGMYVSNKSDHVYLGLKSETLNPNINREDAVLGWGDNTLSDGANGSDNLRFIFTSNTTGSQFPANSINGLEVARMVPDTASTLPTNFGMMGIGDFSPGSPNNGVTAGIINYVDAKLDIDGDLRVRTVLQKDTLLRVLVIDTTDHNRVYYRDIALGTGGKGFYSCADTSGGDTLISDSRINLNNFNLYFEKNDSLGVNHVGIGYNCGDNLRAKLSVQQLHPVMVNQSTIAISGINKDTSNVQNTSYTGVEGAAIGYQNQPKVINRGGYFGAKNSQETRGLVAEIQNSSINTSSAFGGEFLVSAVANDNRGVSASVTGNGGTGSSTNTGVFGNAENSGLLNTGGKFFGNSSNNTNGSAVGVSGSATGSSVSNVGGAFSVVPNYNAVNIATSGRIFSPVNAYTYPSVVAIGVYGYANTNPIAEYAGFFDGNVWVNGAITATGTISSTSDQNLKTDINPINNANGILNQLHPKTFYFDTLNPYGFNFSNRKQYGLIAQQVETILPELVTNKFKPATVDSSGTVVNPSMNYKALNYDAFISILIKGYQEQSHKIDSLQNRIENRDSVINNLNDRLSHLESCLSGILPFLCQISHNSIQPTQQEFQQQLKAQIDVQLSNKGTIILNQNVPNPFAEQTQISFSIPETVKKAQIHFYDVNGKLINSVEVQERGLGQLNVFANDLSTGMYTYTLVADGQIVATKKMMKQ